MKKKYFRHLGVVALALTLVSMTLTGGTLARYVTEVTGTAKAEVAAWSFKANSNEDGKQFTQIDLGSTANRTAYDGKTVVDGVIAPGTSGSFDILLDGTGSEVGIDYIVTLAEKTADNPKLPADLTIKVTNGNEAEKAYSLGDEITGTIDYVSGEKAMQRKIKVSWSWDFGTDDTKTSNDNTYQNTTFNLDITATGKQTAPVTATPAA